MLGFGFVDWEAEGGSDEARDPCEGRSGVVGDVDDEVVDIGFEWFTFNLIIIYSIAQLSLFSVCENDQGHSSTRRAPLYIEHVRTIGMMIACSK